MITDLIQLKEKTEEKKRIENLLKKAERELLAEKEKLEKLKTQLKKEYDDVQRIENGGLTALFFGLLGSKEKKLDKERQEYLAAKLRYDNCKKQIEDLEAEVQKLKKEFLASGHPDVEYKKLFEEKKLNLRAAGDDQLRKYEELLGYCFSQKKEVNEAIYAGERALQGLGYAIKAQKTARGWGTVDMLGGGLITTAIKHGNIDDAQQMIHSSQIWLRRFRRELADIQNTGYAGLEVELNGFATFADFFFDNLIFDWMVQNKINRSLDACEKTRSQVAKIVAKLKETDKSLTQKYRSTKTDFTNYIHTHS